MLRNPNGVLAAQEAASLGSQLQRSYATSSDTSKATLTYLPGRYEAGCCRTTYAGSDTYRPSPQLTGYCAAAVGQHLDPGTGLKMKISLYLGSLHQQVNTAKATRLSFTKLEL